MNSITSLMSPYVALLFNVRIDFAVKAIFLVLCVYFLTTREKVSLSTYWHKPWVALKILLPS